jgi:hypothetical protein
MASLSFEVSSSDHTDDPIKVGSVGVKEVDEDTMFRIGSISKLWTNLQLRHVFRDGLVEVPRSFQSHEEIHCPQLRYAANSDISKLWTMYLFMTLEGTRYFHEPVSKYVPELQIEYSSTSLTPTDPTLIGSSVW